MYFVQFSPWVARVAATVIAATAMTAGGVVSVAAPRVESQPGTQEKKQSAPVAPAQQPMRYAPQTQPVQQVEVVRWVPGAPQAVQPVIVKNVVTQEIVYETSPGLALASAGGSHVLDPVNVANTFNRNIRDEDRDTLYAAGGAAAAGAVGGAALGAVGGAVVGGAGGAALGAVGGAGMCAAAGTAMVLAPVTSPVTGYAVLGCSTLGPYALGAAVGGISGGSAGAVVGAAPGALMGAQAGASVVPGGRAALDRTIADTTWDLESQARVSQGAEPLAGEKPGESMPSGPEAAAAYSPQLEVPTVPELEQSIPDVPVPETVVPVEVSVEPVPLLDVPLPEVSLPVVPDSPFAVV